MNYRSVVVAVACALPLLACGSSDDVTLMQVQWASKAASGAALKRFESSVNLTMAITENFNLVMAWAAKNMEKVKPACNAKDQSIILKVQQGFRQAFDAHAQTRALAELHPHRSFVALLQRDPAPAEKNSENMPQWTTIDECQTAKLYTAKGTVARNAMQLCFEKTGYQSPIAECMVEDSVYQNTNCVKKCMAHPFDKDCVSCPAGNIENLHMCMGKARGMSEECSKCSASGPKYHLENCAVDCMKTSGQGEDCLACGKKVAAMTC